MAPLLFRRSAFRLQGTGCFWLSETPEVPGSKSWGSNYPRTVTWAKLACQKSGRVLIFVNTHFDYHPPAIDGDAQALRQWLDRIREEAPLIVTGDFNAEKDSLAYHMLTKGGALSDAFRQVKPQGTDEVTFHAYGRAEEMAAIDWILVSDHFRVHSADIDRTRQGNLFPSDHYPLKAVLDWEW